MTVYLPPPVLDLLLAVWPVWPGPKLTAARVLAFLGEDLHLGAVHGAHGPDQPQHSLPDSRLLDNTLQSSLLLSVDPPCRTSRQHSWVSRTRRLENSVVRLSVTCEWSRNIHCILVLNLPSMCGVLRIYQRMTVCISKVSAQTFTTL